MKPAGPSLHSRLVISFRQLGYRFQRRASDRKTLGWPKIVEEIRKQSPCESAYFIIMNHGIGASTCSRKSQFVSFGIPLSASNWRNTSPDKTRVAIIRIELEASFANCGIPIATKSQRSTLRIHSRRRKPAKFVLTKKKRKIVGHATRPSRRVVVTGHRRAVIYREAREPRKLHPGKRIPESPLPSAGGSDLILDARRAMCE